jgi:hypothetical protein
MSTIIFIAEAPMKLKIGQLRPNKVNPPREITDEMIATGRHQLDGIIIPRKPKAERVNPSAISSHRIPATSFSPFFVIFTNGIDFAGFQKPSVWPIPCTNNAPAIRMRIVCVGIEPLFLVVLVFDKLFPSG